MYMYVICVKGNECLPYQFVADVQTELLLIGLLGEKIENYTIDITLLIEIKKSGLLYCFCVLYNYVLKKH